jgi:argininosuccinate lyase
LASLLRQVSTEVTGREIAYTDERLAEILSPRHFVEVRKTYGGPSPSETLRAIGVSKESLAADRGWLAAARGRLAAASEQLKAAAETL